MKKTIELKNTKIDIKIRLAGLWTSIMFLYIYNDFFSLFKPGALEDMISGRMGPFEATQLALFSAAVLMVIPSVMIFASLALKAQFGKWLNVVMGVLYFVVMVVSMKGEWNFYIFMGLVELVLTASIVWLSLKWPQNH